MAILQLPLPIAANTGVIPNQVQMAVTDDLTTVTTPGYLKFTDLQSYTLSENSEIHIRYNASATDETKGELAVLRVSITNGVITLIPVAQKIFWLPTQVITVAELNAGNVILLDPLATASYIVRDIFFIPDVDFAGGDRGVELTDGTTSYAQVGPTGLATQVTARWGDTFLEFPAGSDVVAPTVVGQDLLVKYFGGSGDFSSGSFKISVLLQQVS